MEGAAWPRCDFAGWTMTTEELALLHKAAADPRGQIAVKRNPNGSWHGDRDHLQALADRGHVMTLGESMGRTSAARSPFGKSRLKAARSSNGP